MKLRVDLALTALIIVIGLSIITTPPGGTIDGRHLLAVAATTTLALRAALERIHR